MSEIPDWASGTNDGIHKWPANSDPGAVLPSADALQQLLKDLFEGIVRQIVLKVVGVLLPGPAGEQLAAWANGLLDNFSLIFDAFDGIDLGDPGAVVAAIVKAVGQVINTLLGGLTGSGTANGDLGALGYLLAGPLQTIAALQTAVAQLQQQLQAGFARVDGRFDAIQSSLTTGATTSGFDNFNRTTGIGTKWTAFPGVPLIQIFNGPFSGGYVQTNFRSAGYFNAAEPATDKHGVLIKVVNKSSGTCRAMLSGDVNGSNYAGVEVGAGLVGDDYVRMITGSSPVNVVAHQQQNLTLDNEFVIDIRYDPATNQYIVAVNQNEAFRWTDTANIVTHGASKRKCAILSNGNDFSLFGFGMGFAITDFTFYDW